MLYVQGVNDNASTPNVPQVVAGVAPPAAVEPAQSRIAELLPELPAYLENSLENLCDDKGLHWQARKFSAEEKEAFVRAYATNGGRFLEACAHIKAGAEVVYRHLEYDPQWARALKQAKLSMGEAIAAVSMEVAMTPTGTTDRMAQLKRFFPKVYRNQEQTPSIAVQINLDGGRSA